MIIKQIYPNKCSQCGFCCKNEVCPIGQILSKSDKPPCKFLIFNDSKYYCGIVLWADDISKIWGNEFKKIIGIGVGCDSQKLFEREEQKLLKLSEADP